MIPMVCVIRDQHVCPEAGPSTNQSQAMAKPRDISKYVRTEEPTGHLWTPSLRLCFFVTFCFSRSTCAFGIFLRPSDGFHVPRASTFPSATHVVRASDRAPGILLPMYFTNTANTRYQLVQKVGEEVTAGISPPCPWLVMAIFVAPCQRVRHNLS